MNSENYPDYYKGYIDRIPAGEPNQLLESGLKETLISLAMVSEEKAAESYEEGKWSIKDVLQHIIDTERIFCFRALSIARGEKEGISGYDHNAYAKRGEANQRTLKSLLEEYKRLRASTIDLFKSFSSTAYVEEGSANGLKFTPEQIQYIIIGHELHHINVIQQRYLP